MPTNERVTSADILKRSQRYEIFGQEYTPGELPTQSKYPSGIRDAMSRAAMGAWSDVKNRWHSITDSKRHITKEEFDEIVGDRDVEWHPDMTQRQASFLRDEYDHEQYMEQYERRPISEFIGMMAPYVVDPVSIATMPVGGTSMKVALQAGKSLRHYARHATSSGAQIGVASAPVEASIHQRAYGEFRPDIFAGSVLGPVAAAPIVGAPARALRGINFRQSRGKDLTSRAEITQPETSTQPHRYLDTLQELDRYPGVRRPPQMREPGGLHQPDSRIREMFRDYEGGPRQYIRDSVRRPERFREKSRQLNIDPDSPVMRNFLARHKEATVSRRRPDSVERFDDREAMMDFVHRRSTEEQRQRLRNKGVINDHDQFTNTYWNLGESLRKPRQKLSKTQWEDFRNFQRRGLDGVYNSYIKRNRAEYERALETQKKAGRRALKQKAEGREPSERLIREVQEAAARRQQAAEKLETAREAIGVADGEFPMRDFMIAVDAARLESPIARPVNHSKQVPPRRPETPEAHGPIRETIERSDVEDSRKFAEQHGVEDPDGPHRWIDEELRYC